MIRCFFCSLLFFSLCMSIEAKEGSTAFVTQFLRQQGASLDSEKQVEFIERGMTHVYKIHHPEAWYLKFTPQKQRSSGAFYPKRLWAPTTDALRRHGARRRACVRPLICKINTRAGKHLLIPPYPLDLDQKVWESMTPAPDKISHPKLALHIATGWLGINGVANPYHDGSIYLWSPKSYPASNVRELALHLKKISDLAIDYLDEASIEVLSHERDRYLDYAALLSPFLKELGLENFSLKTVLDQIENPRSPVWKQLTSQAQKRMRQVEKRVDYIGKIYHHNEESLEEVQSAFYEKKRHLLLQAVKSKASVSENAPSFLEFFRCVFILEKEGMLAEEMRLLGRNLAQCAVAYQLADDILQGKGVMIKALFMLLDNIACYYDVFHRAPKSLIHGDAHPHEFLQDEEGNWTLGGCEYLHVGCVYRDIAQEYVRKLVRDYLRETTSQKETLEKIQAALIPGWFDEFLPDIMGCCVVEFAQELETLFSAYSMDIEKLDFLNLTITPKTYLDEMQKRIVFENCYRKELFPLLSMEASIEKGAL